MGFYCDNCGKKVEIDCDECPSCGVLFKAVKCPRCSYSGKSEEFEKGCPSCGYQAKEPDCTEKIPLTVPEQNKRVWKQYLSDKTFWVMGLLMLLLIPVLIYLLLSS